MLLDFLQVLPERQPQLLRAEGQQVRWQPPPVTKLKANFDGAVFREDKRAGLGVVITKPSRSGPRFLVREYHASTFHRGR